MNELLLILLIVCTLLTFWSLNKKMGTMSGSIPLPIPALQPEQEKDITKVIYSAKEKEYKQLWSITSIAGNLAQEVNDKKNEMVVIYHQLCGKNDHAYHNSIEKDGRLEVCVISSISDVHYRHVMLPADFKI